ncbi:MAG: IPT/TIG domain-containing protein [Elusimicrobia bacterium]|nr:IPT/TIG domain-containing protein [Elusimicrobiota bacterium]
MTFRIFNTQSAGDPLFIETRTVSVSTGIFNVLIGETTSGGIPVSVFDGADKFIEVQVGSQILPRQRIASVGYSLRSQVASFADQSSTASFAQTAGALAGSSTTISVTSVTATTINVTSITVNNISITSASVQTSVLVGGGVKVGHSIILGTVSGTLGAPNTIAFDNGDGIIQTVAPGAGKLSLMTTGAEHILLNPGAGGNVGIGTSIPETALHVAAGVITSGQASTLTGGLKLYSATSSSSTILTAGSPTTAVIYKLPPADGQPGQVLSTDGNGNLSWATRAVSGPSVTSISPNSGPTNGGTAVTIYGTGFLVGSVVTIAGVTATNVVVVSSLQITAVTGFAPSAVTGNVTVISPNNLTSTLTNGFTYLAVSITGCASGNNAQEFIPGGMVACAGAVTWVNSSSLCGFGWHGCNWNNLSVSLPGGIIINGLTFTKPNPIFFCGKPIGTPITVSCVQIPGPNQNYWLPDLTGFDYQSISYPALGSCANYTPSMIPVAGGYFNKNCSDCSGRINPTCVSDVWDGQGGFVSIADQNTLLGAMCCKSPF